jgi:ferredoxin
MPFKIVVDRDRCEANAVCVRDAPGIFTIDDAEIMQVVVERPGEDRRKDVEKAVRRCPRKALAIVEE